MPRGMLYGGSYDAIAGQEMNRDQARDSRYFNSLNQRRALEEMQFRQQQAQLQNQLAMMEMAERIKQNRLQTMFSRQDRGDARRDRLMDMMLENQRFQQGLGFRREQQGHELADLARQREDEAALSQGGADSANAQLDLATRGHREDLLGQITGIEDTLNQNLRGPNMPRWFPGGDGTEGTLRREAAQQMMKLTGGKPLFDVTLPSKQLSELLTSILKSRDDLRYDESSGRFVPALRRSTAKQPSIIRNTNQEALLISAQDAIRRGADPAAVRKRLQEKYGISLAQ